MKIDMNIYHYIFITVKTLLKKSLSDKRKKRQRQECQQTL
jgi:hypothetical protein